MRHQIANCFTAAQLLLSVSMSTFVLLLLLSSLSLSLFLTINKAAFLCGIVVDGVGVTPSSSVVNERIAPNEQR